MTVRTLRIVSCAAALLLPGLGCDIDIDVNDTGGDGPADDGADDQGEDGAQQTGEDGSEDQGEDQGEDGGEDTGGPAGECDPLAQDCPDGEGCYGAAQGFICAPVADPGQAGDACEFVNTCDAGLQCVAGDAVAGCNDTGCCVLFCDLSNDAACDDPDTECTPYFEEGQAPPGFEDVGLCLGDNGGDDDGGDDGGGPALECDPLAQDCPAGEACYGSADGLLCAPVAGNGQVGDLCEFVNTCDAGLMCINEDFAPGCEGGAACCASFCDVDDAGACDGATSCIPYFEEGAAPPGFEQVGLCALDA